MTEQEANELTVKIREIVSEFAQQHGVKVIMCAIVNIDNAQLSPTPPVVGFTNMDYKEMGAALIRLHQIHNIIQKSEDGILRIPFSLN